MKTIRIIVIDDSAFMRKMISDILNSDPRMEVIATARNGEDGLTKIKELNPDVATLDVHMPVMDGIDALEQIMKSNPIPIVMLSSDTLEGAEKTVQAISTGAVDFIRKPSGAISLDIKKIHQEIVAKVYAASQVTFKHCASKPKPTRNLNPTQRKVYERTIITIGTSTGGPRALQKVLKSLPENFTAPILIVQHMPASFTKSLADRLDLLSSIHVKEAVHGELIKDKTAYIAPGDFHMTVKKVGTSLAICLTKEESVKGHRPSVDVLFNSIATIRKMNKIAAILTGMGNDGTQGIKNIIESDSGSIIIAESEETSIVYGMPKAAIQSKNVDYIMPLDEISSLLVKLTNI